MACIRPYHGKWRAEVERHGQRKSKVAATEEEARLWALHMEQELDSGARRYSPREQFVKNGAHLVTFVPRCVLEASRAIPHSQTDVIEAAIPMSRASGVYFLRLSGFPC